MILPHERQLGAGAKSGWIVVLQVHFRGVVDEVGLVESSRAAMAAVRSLMEDVVVVDAEPLLGVEVPEWAGFLDCFAFTLGR